MRARALLVPRDHGEVTRQELVAADALRTDLEILEEDDRLAFPLHADAKVPPVWGEVGEREFVPRRSIGPAEFRGLLAWSETDKLLLPRSFDVVGEIVLIRLPPELEARRFEVGEALLAFVPGARLVGWDRGVHGAERRRSVERIAGTGGWATRHRENRLEFDVDVEQAYFSPRLAGEHARIAAEVREGERVYDLCCGVGPFAVTIARAGRARSVVAVDANPAAVELLRATLRRYPFGSKVTALESRVEEFAASAPPADRVVLNLPHEGLRFAGRVAPLVAPAGELDFYEVADRGILDARSAAIVETLPPPGSWSVRSIRVVHPYSPSSDLIAVSVVRRAE